MRKKFKAVLMSVMLMVFVLSTGGQVFAATHEDEAWYVAAYNPGSIKSSTIVEMYNTNEKLEWSVTTITPGTFSYVTLSGANCTVKMADNKTIHISATGKKYFYISNVKTTSSNPYAKLRISLTYEEYVTYYGGRVKIIH